MSKLIKVSNETHGDLGKIGFKSETFDQIIQRLLAEKKSGAARQRRRQETGRADATGLKTTRDQSSADKDQESST